MNAFQKLTRQLMQRVFSMNLSAREIMRVLPRDAIEAIDCPQFVKPQGTQQMTAGERVIGVALNGEFRAYPVRILSAHEVVNDTVGGVPVSVTWSPISYSGNVFQRTVLGNHLTFAVSGNLIRNVPLLYDRETDTYWNQLTGAGITGPLSGNKLKTIPSVITTWDSWLRACPLTIVLAKEKCPYGGYEEDHMADYYRSDKAGVCLPVHNDSRLPQKEIVLGFADGETVRAYPLSLLENTGVLHDNLYNNPVIVLYDKEAEAGVLYRAQIDGFNLSFYEKDGSFYDCLTGSRWLALTGQAVEGPLAGKCLEQLPATMAFWFAWSDHFAGCSIYTLPVLS